MSSLADGALAPAPLIVRTTPIDAAQASDLVGLLPRTDPVSWIRQGQGLVGWGVAAAVHTRGATRFTDADKWLRERTAQAVVDDAVGEPGTGLVAFGSFAFADDPGDSVLVIPEVIVGRRAETAWVTTISTALTPAPTLHQAGPASAPAQVRFADGSAYRYWSGVAWSPVAATAIGVVPGSNSGLSVAWNDDLGSYVSVSTPGLSKDVQLSTAPAPEGPWSSPRTIHTEVTGIYATRIHPELGTSGANRIVVSYFRQDQPDRKGAVVLLELPVS